jgi:hypothetical protein
MLPTTAFKAHIATSHSGAQAAEPTSPTTHSPSPPCTEEYRVLQSLCQQLNSAKAAGQKADPDRLLPGIQSCLTSGRTRQLPRRRRSRSPAPPSSREAVGDTSTRGPARLDRLAECSECAQPVLERAVDEHLRQAHGCLLCPWCANAHSENSLRIHMQESHPPREQCRICRDTVDGLKHHMAVCHEECHKCLYCDDVVSPDEVDLHLANRHQAAPCEHCNAMLPESKSREHLQQEHHYVQCCYCTHFGARDEVQAHTRRHLQSGTTGEPRKRKRAN